MDERFTLQELVAEASARLAALPPPRNGQVRAVPDDRTIRYYATLGLLDRPAAMRGRTALYSVRHLAQVVAIKRMQSAGKSLAEIQTLWPTLDDVTLARMSGVALPVTVRPPAPREFWKREPAQSVATAPAMAMRAVAPPVEIRIELAPGAFITVGVPDGVSLSSADIRALRAAAAPLVTELAHRGLTTEEIP
jgi:DNA-binding transcriptional MerR regulator